MLTRESKPNNSNLDSLCEPLAWTLRGVFPSFAPEPTFALAFTLIFLAQYNTSQAWHSKPTQIQRIKVAILIPSQNPIALVFFVPHQRPKLENFEDSNSTLSSD